MNGFIQLSSQERNLYCRQASEKMEVSLPPAVIEKDFWVCWILQILNEIPELKGNITFKGGTSLSKAFGLIDRFSEDIDIAINRRVFGQEPPFGAEDAESNRQRKLRLEELERKSQSFILDDLIPKLKVKIEQYLLPNEFSIRPIKKGNEVNIEFEYPGTLKDELGALLPIVLIELVPRADEIPNEERKITPFLFDVFSDILGDGSFKTSVLAAERTFLEKTLFIHETLEGFNKGSERKSRHFYDLYKLYNVGIFDKIKSNSKLLDLVIEHRQIFFKYTALDYNSILTKGIKFLPSQKFLPDWKSDYSRTEIMIYNDKPDFETLMTFAEHFESEFNIWISKRQ
jgi:hypothetical protein